MSGNTVIQIMCPKLTCRRILAVPIVARGKMVRCRGCGSTIRVPEAKKAPQDPQASAPLHGEAEEGNEQKLAS